MSDGSANKGVFEFGKSTEGGKGVEVGKGEDQVTVNPNIHPTTQALHMMCEMIRR